MAKAVVGRTVLRRRGGGPLGPRRDPCRETVPPTESGAGTTDLGDWLVFNAVVLCVSPKHLADREFIEANVSVLKGSG